MLKILVRVLLLAVIAPLSATIVPVIALRWLPPPTTSFMLQSPTRPVQYQWVASQQIADVIRKAVVASEDQKFWMHRGFDLEAIQKAREHNQKSRKIRGGSTISQQTAKNLFLWPGGGYLRKGVEAYFTILIETLWPKGRILEVYLNIAEFGPGIYGVEAASRAFFRKPAAQVTPAEAARLAAVLPSPRRWRAANPGPYVQSRSNWILGQIGYAPKPAPEEEEPWWDELFDDEPAAAPAAATAVPATERPVVPAEPLSEEITAEPEPAAPEPEPQSTTELAPLPEEPTQN